ncbi:hypothetical protein BC830DRAFT_1123489 [Chytriomyces sp. MP71]|nr:hypothetical protein BC830DRAFT_1123489 [Chytriomyces sp. MP71]
MPPKSKNSGVVDGVVRTAKRQRKAAPKSDPESEDEAADAAPETTRNSQLLVCIPNSTLAFLRELKLNNAKEWFYAHDSEYKAARKNFVNFVRSQAALLSRTDPSVAGSATDVGASAALFRINRDIRFSADPTPYKTSLSAAISRSGKRNNVAEACYYVVVEPNGNSRFGCGVYMPPNPTLTHLRETLVSNATLKSNLVQALNSPALLALIPAPVDTEVEDPGIARLHASAVKNNLILKTAPKGFAASHPDIHLLRLKSFTLGITLTDDVVESDEFPTRCSEFFTAVAPFVLALNALLRE